MNYSKANLEVRHVASTNPFERSLNCVHLSGDGATVATNGKVIMAVGPATDISFPDVGEVVEPPEGGLNVPLDMVADAVKNLPKDRTMQNVAMTKHPYGRVELTTSDTRSEKRVSQHPIPGAYVDWKTVLRNACGSKPVKVCFNRRDMIELLKALDSACPDKSGENPVYLEIAEDGRGMVMRCFNRQTKQRAIGGMTAYATAGHWLPSDSWERKVFNRKKAVKKRSMKHG